MAHTATDLGHKSATSLVGRCLGYINYPTEVVDVE